METLWNNPAQLHAKLQHIFHLIKVLKTKQNAKYSKQVKNRQLHTSRTIEGPWGMS